MPEGLGLVLPTKVLPFAKSRLFSWPEKARMARDLVAPRSLGPEDIAVGTYLRRRLGSPIVERLAGPLVGGVYGTPIDQLSLDAVVPQLRTAEAEHRSLLRAGLADGRKQREMAAKRPPGAKSLGVFQSLRGGMGTLVDALADSLAVAGADVRTGVAVRAMSRAGSGVAVRLGDGSIERFDGAIVATPAPVAAWLLEAEVPGAAAALEAIPHGTSILVTLAYPRSAVGRDLVGHGYLVPPTEGGAISACTWSSEKWAGRAPADTVLLRMFVRDEGTWTSLPEDELIAAARADAEATLRITGEPSPGPRLALGRRHAALHRWPPRPCRRRGGGRLGVARGHRRRCLVPGRGPARLHHLRPRGRGRGSGSGWPAAQRGTRPSRRCPPTLGLTPRGSYWRPRPSW